jgi:hypothetical protein
VFDASAHQPSDGIIVKHEPAAADEKRWKFALADGCSHL